MLLAFFTFSPAELGVVAVIALLLFGKRLPETMRSLGSSFSEFKKGIREAEDVQDLLTHTTQEINREAKRQIPERKDA